MTTPARTVVLDNEAVQALADPDRPKHRRVTSIVEAATRRNLRRTGTHDPGRSGRGAGRSRLGTARP